MRSCRLSAFISLALIVAACSPAAEASKSADPSKSAPQTPAGSSLNGAWQGNVQFTNGPFAPVKDLRFLYVYNAGGTMTESSNYDGVPRARLARLHRQQESARVDRPSARRYRQRLSGRRRRKSLRPGMRR